mgnify:CR=1 FL=1
MKIGIDLHTITDFMQGSRTYIYNMTKALLDIDQENLYYLYFTQNISLPSELNKSNVVNKRIIPKNKFIRIPFSFPLLLYRDNIDLFFCQYMGIPWGNVPFVVTLHDIIHEEHPEYYPRLLRKIMQITYPQSAHRAYAVFTVSEYSKSSIASLYKVPAEKITVTYDAVSPEFRPIHDSKSLDAVRQKYGLPKDYILFVGRIEPRKNIQGLMHAFAQLIKLQQIPHKLAIVGMKDKLFTAFYKQIKSTGLVERIVFTGGVEQADLPYVYSAADLFVYPSFAEGFGIPPLEAMACGVPVISSNRTALPEVVGTAAKTVDPEDADHLAQTMLSILKSPETKKDMIDRGLVQAQNFSWTKSAQKALAVFTQLKEKA